MGVRRGEQRTTPLTNAATGSALFPPALAALVTAAVTLDALDLATAALAAAALALAAAALATAAFSASTIRLHFFRRAQLPRLCGRRGRHLHHRRLHRQQLRAVQPCGHVR